MNDIYIKGIELPARVRGNVVKIEDDFFVFVNTVLSPERQRCAAEHELMHIKKDHFFNEEPVIHDELEAGYGI